MHPWLSTYGLRIGRRERQNRIRLSARPDYMPLLYLGICRALIRLIMPRRLVRPF